MNRALSECEKVYSSWKNFAAGYLCGMAMTRGAGDYLKSVIYMCEELLRDTRSPWNKAEF